MTPRPSEPVRLYTINQVAKVCGVARGTVDRWHRDRNDFPRKVLLGPNCARFIAAEIDGWIACAQVDHRG